MLYFKTTTADQYGNRHVQKCGPEAAIFVHGLENGGNY
jgi:hypothetical protein